MAQWRNGLKPSVHDTDAFKGVWQKGLITDPYTTRRLQSKYRLNLEVAAQLPYQAVSQAMYRMRQGANLEIPATLEAYGEAMAGNPRFFTMDPHNPLEFYRVTLTHEDGGVAVVFVSPTVERSTTLHTSTLQVDGTFKVVPHRPFAYQLLTMSVILYDHASPLVSVMMNEKTQALYELVFNYVHQNLPLLEPRNIVCDFEVGLQNALRLTWPAATVVGCWFHSADAMNRRAKFLGMTELLKTNRHAKRVYKMCQVLALLPPDHVQGGFEYIHDTAEQNQVLEHPAMVRFLEYVSRVWIRGVGARSFSVYKQTERTNNNMEAYHRRLKDAVGQVHPNIWHFTDCLRQEERQSAVALTSLSQGRKPFRAPSLTYLLTDERIREYTRKYDNGEYNLPEMLGACSHILDDLHNPDNYQLEDVDEEDVIVAEGLRNANLVPDEDPAFIGPLLPGARRGLGRRAPRGRDRRLRGRGPLRGRGIRGRGGARARGLAHNAAAALDNLTDEVTLTHEDGGVAVVFVSPTVERSTTLHTSTLQVDGTFKVVPHRPFAYQLLTMSVILYDHASPLVSVMMNEKTQALYELVFNYVHQNLPLLEPRNIVCDFEVGLQNALRLTWPAATVVGCWFHSADAMNRRAKFLGMTELLKTNRHAKRVYKMCQVLALLPPDHVQGGFEYIHDTAEQNQVLEHPAMVRFLEYVSRVWIRGVGARSFSVYKQTERTNNNMEAYHRRLKDAVGQVHPNIWHFTDCLRQEERQSAVALTSLSQGRKPFRAPSLTYLLTDERIREYTRKYDNGEYNLPEMLGACSHILDDLHNPDNYQLEDVDEEDVIVAEGLRNANLVPDEDPAFIGPLLPGARRGLGRRAPRGRDRRLRGRGPLRGRGIRGRGGARARGLAHNAAAVLFNEEDPDDPEAVAPQIEEPVAEPRHAVPAMAYGCRICGSVTMELMVAVPCFHAAVCDLCLPVLGRDNQEIIRCIICNMATERFEALRFN